MDDSNNSQLILFLRTLADSIESNQIQPDKLQHVGEFFMNYQFLINDI